MQAVLALQIVGNPEEIEPPDGVNHEFSSGKRPRLPVRQKLAPLYFPSLPEGWILVVLQFRAGAGRMFFGFSIEPQPENEPGKSQRSGQQECPTPAKMDGNPWHDKRRNNCTDTRAGIKDAGCQRPLLFWKPFRHVLEAGRKYSDLA